VTSKWPLVPIGNLVQHKRDGAILTDEKEFELWSIPSFEVGKPEFVNGSEIGSGKFSIQHSDVLLAKINPRINRVCVVREACGVAPQIASTEWIVLRPGLDSVNSQYLAYFLQSDTFREIFTASTTGTTGSHTRGKPDVALQTKIPLPPLDEQKRIVAKLDEAMRFIDQINSREATRVNEAHRFATSILTGLIPPTKDSTSIMDVCDFKGGAQPPKSTFIHTPQSGYVRFIQIRDFESDAHVVFIPESTKNRTCLESDVLVGRYGASVGRICRGLAGAYNVALMKVVPDIGKVTTDFLEIFLKSDFFQKPLLELSVRSAQSGFNKEDLATIQFPKVSLDEQAVLVEKYWAINALVSDLLRNSGQKSASVTDFRSSMLSAAFAGEL